MNADECAPGEELVPTGPADSVEMTCGPADPADWLEGGVLPETGVDPLLGILAAIVLVAAGVALRLSLLLDDGVDDRGDARADPRTS